MSDELRCFFHDECPVGPDTYVVCFECQHAFTAQELLTLANEEARKVAYKPSWGFVKEAYVDPGYVRVCPLCTHDL